jgi:hypothetical protein
VIQVYDSPLQSIIGEFKNISPEIVNCFIFEKTGEILACNETTVEEQSKNLILALKSLADQSNVIGGIHALTIHGVENQLDIIEMNNRFLTTVFTGSANKKIVKSLTQVIVPTVLALAYPNGSRDEDEGSVEHVKIEPKPEVIQEEPSLIDVYDRKDSMPEIASFTCEPLAPKPFASQLMVEKIGGLLVASDTVRIDNDIIVKWHNMYDDRQIAEVNIENLEGKSTTCKFKPIKEAYSKGIIQIPEKILLTLQTDKGKLVVVKPVLMQMKEKKD